MKSSFIRLLVMLMVPVMLVASSGVVLLIHTCFTSESVEVTLFQRSGCCADRPCHPIHNDGHADENSIQGKCCDLKADYIKVQVCSSLENDPSSLALIYPVVSGVSSDRRLESADPIATVFPVAASPPVKASTPEYIYSVHQLLI